MSGNNPHISKLRVRYAETDQMGVVYYANYLVWMEVARVDYCHAIGFNYHEMEREHGIFLAVAESNCRYKSPARFDDEVTIATIAKDASRRMVTFEYEMSCGDRRLAIGHTRHVWVGRNMRPVQLPDKYAALFGIE